MIALGTLLEDPRVQVLLAAARHMHTAMSCATNLRTQRRCAENLDFALKPFELAEGADTLVPDCAKVAR